jgi:hypothetical protein
MSQETGHAKNVANFFRLITLCQSYGARYNPFHPALQISSLTIAHADAENAVTNHHNQQAVYKANIAARQNLFKATTLLPTRLIAVLQSNFADPKTITDARHFAKKMRGERIIKLPKANIAPSQTPTLQNTPNPQDTTPANNNPDPQSTTTTTVSRRNSVSQRSFDQQINHFSQLISLLNNNSNYQTNDPDLQLFALQSNLTQLQTVNNNAITAEIGLNTTLSQRNKTLYLGENNLLQLASAIKNYIKSSFGIKSPEYKDVAALKFTVIKT